MNEKRILITGATGSLGKVIVARLKRSGVNCFRLARSLPDDVDDNFISVDLGKTIPPLPDLRFDQVIHCAGLAHVNEKLAINSEDAFFRANVEGTRNLLKGLDSISEKPTQFVLISSISVYGLMSGVCIDEHQPVSPNSFYSKTKLKQEEEVSNWCADRNISCVIYRLPLVACASPKGNLAKLQLSSRRKIQFRIGGVSPKKSIVLATDVAELIHGKYNASGIYNLTDQYDPTFSEITDAVTPKSLDPKMFVVPYWICKTIAIGCDFVRPLLRNIPYNSDVLMKVTSPLTFDSMKATSDLGWNPTSAVQVIPTYIKSSENIN